MTSTLVTDYLGRGTRAARPSSPPVGSAAGAVYFATDTAEWFTWNGSAWVQAALLSSPSYSVLAPAAVTASTGQTLSAAQLVGGLVTRSGPSGAVTDTTDTATAILAAIPDGAVNASFRLRYVNTVAQIITLAGGSGVTLAGATTIPANAIVEILGLVTATGSPAVTLYIATAGAAAAGSTPLVSGIGAAGSSAGFARGDHVHPSFPTRGHIAGLAISNDGVTPNTKLDIAAGQATDSTAAMVMNAGALTIDFTTTGANALDTGAIGATTWYHVFLIGQAGGTAAGLASLSATAPTLPGGYGYFRRIGSVKTDAGSHLLAFSQKAERFWFTAGPTTDASATSIGTSASLITLTVPTGVAVQADFRAFEATSTNTILFSSPFEPDIAPSTVHTSGPGYDVPSGGSTLGRELVLYTNASAQIRARAGGASTNLYIYTKGWIDDRGKFD